MSLNNKPLVGKIFFIDFDDVLLDTKSFKNDYFKVFEKFGISAEKAEAEYKKMREQIAVYDLDTHISFIKKTFPGLEREPAKKVLYDFFGNSSKYVFKDSQPFLSFLKSHDCRIELITTGDPWVQKKKVFSSGLKDFFGKIHYVDTDYKSNWIKKSLRGKKDFFVFIDDKPKPLQDVKENFPNSLVIQIIRHNGALKSDTADKIVYNLGQVKKIL